MHSGHGSLTTRSRTEPHRWSSDLLEVDPFALAHSVRILFFPMLTNALQPEKTLYLAIDGKDFADVMQTYAT